MSNLLDQILKDYEKRENQPNQEIPREQTAKEFELLTDYVLNDNLQSIYDYYELKEKLDKEWVDSEMLHHHQVTEFWNY